jgi:hypothetical protein
LFWRKDKLTCHLPCFHHLIPARVGSIGRTARTTLAVSYTYCQERRVKVDGCKPTCSSWICFIPTFNGSELGICKLSSPLVARGARGAEMRMDPRINAYERTIMLCNLKSSPDCKPRVLLLTFQHPAAHPLGKMMRLGLEIRELDSSAAFLI